MMSNPLNNRIKLLHQFKMLHQLRMMWLLKFCCVLVLPSIIQSIELVDYLDQMATENRTINGVFELVPRGYISEGTYAVVYRGIRIADRRPVALKFVGIDNEEQTIQEYKVCTCLEAIDKPEVEQFGIPAIYYYGEFLDGSFIVIALTLLEQSLMSKMEEDHFVKNPINSLILLKQFILASKYMHSKGIRHDDIKPENIMFRKNRIFLIDFNLSSKILEKKHGGTLEYTARRTHTLDLRTPMDDWESFLYVLAEVNHVKLKFLPNMGFDVSNTAKAFRDAGKMKLNTKITIIAINRRLDAMKDRMDDQLKDFRRVFHAFAEHVLCSNKTFPDYDRMHHTVQEAIESMIKPLPAHFAFFTWLKPAEITGAQQEVARHLIPDIENALIRSPQLIDFTKYPYPEPNFNKFSGIGLMKRVSLTISGVMKSIWR